MSEHTDQVAPEAISAPIPEDLDNWYAQLIREVRGESDLRLLIRSSDVARLIERIASLEQQLAALKKSDADRAQELLVLKASHGELMRLVDTHLRGTEVRAILARAREVQK